MREAVLLGAICSGPAPLKPGYNDASANRTSLLASSVAILRHS
jgi:hypothetical protein